jgi:hypothetical protein
MVWAVGSEETEEGGCGRDSHSMPGVHPQFFALSIAVGGRPLNSRPTSGTPFTLRAVGQRDDSVSVATRRRRPPPLERIFLEVSQSGEYLRRVDRPLIPPLVLKEMQCEFSNGCH